MREQGDKHLFNVNENEGVVRILDNKHSARGEMAEAYSKGKDVRITRDMIAEIESKMTDADKEYLKLTKKFFNEKSRDAKKVTDEQLYGITNIESGYYFPIKVSSDKIYADAGQANNNLVQHVLDLGVNKTTKPNASNKIVIDGIDNIVATHTVTMSMYYGFAVPLTAYNRIMNKQVDADGVDTTSNMRGEIQKIDATFEKYMNNLWLDVQGIPRAGISWFGKMSSYLRWALASSALGANPKILFTQTLSLTSALAEFNPKYVAKGTTHFFGEKEKRDLAKYSSLMWERMRLGNSVDVAETREVGKRIGNKGGAVVAKAIKVIDTVSTKPISWMDSNVIQSLWFAAQYEVADTMGAGYEFGTEKNKKEAGKRLDEVVFRTQQTNDPLGRSASMRETNEIIRFMRMFTGDAIQLVGRWLSSHRRQVVAKRMSKSSDTSIASQGKKMLETSKKTLSKASVAFISNQVFLLAIALAFKWLKGNDDDEEWSEVALNTAIANVVGLLPFGNDLYQTFEGYEPSNAVYSALSDIVEIAKTVESVFSYAVSGNYMSQQEINSLAKKSIIAFGKLFGVPLRNIESYTVGIVSKFSPTSKDEWEANFKVKSNKYYLDKIKVATENGDEKTANTLINIMFNSKTGKIKDDKVLEITRDLIEDGYNVLPKSVGNEVVYDNEKYTLTRNQHDAFIKIYSQATDKIKIMINSHSFRISTDEAKAKAIRFVYDYYYDLALEDLIGEDIEEKNMLFAEAIPIEELAIAVSQSKLYKSDTDSTNKIISGSKKAKVQAFIQGLRLTAVQKYMIMGYLGYSNQYGDRQVESYINGLKLTKTQKEKLYNWSGYSK